MLKWTAPKLYFKGLLFWHQYLSPLRKCRLCTFGSSIPKNKIMCLILLCLILRIEISWQNLSKWMTKSQTHCQCVWEVFTDGNVASAHFLVSRSIQGFRMSTLAWLGWCLRFQEGFLRQDFSLEQWQKILSYILGSLLRWGPYMGHIKVNPVSNNEVLTVVITPNPISPLFPRWWKPRLRPILGWIRFDIL